MALVLLIDDDVDILDALVEVLKPDYDTAIATQGAEALELLNKEKPAAIILDLMMPEVNGWDFLKFKGLRREYDDIPVIIITASTVAEARRRGLDGAHLVLHKPFDLEVLLRAVRTVVKQ